MNEKCFTETCSADSIPRSEVRSKNDNISGVGPSSAKGRMVKNDISKDGPSPAKGRIVKDDISGRGNEKKFEMKRRSFPGPPEMKNTLRPSKHVCIATTQALDTPGVGLKKWSYSVLPRNPATKEIPSKNITSPLNQPRVVLRKRIISVLPGWDRSEPCNKKSPGRGLSRPACYQDMDCSFSLEDESYRRRSVRLAAIRSAMNPAEEAMNMLHF